jgi:hypothetical protein
LQTYEFVVGPTRTFNFGGGLLGLDVASKLAGSFDVKIEDDGSSLLTRFDVRLIDILDRGLYSVSWSEDTALADKLFVHPVGLTGQRVGSSISLGKPYYIVVHEPVLDDPDTIVPYLKPNGPATQIKIALLGNGLAEVRISSQPVTVLDNPVFFSSFDLYARVVPEPGGVSLLLCGAFTLVGGGMRQRRCRA